MHRELSGELISLLSDLAGSRFLLPSLGTVEPLIIHTYPSVDGPGYAL
jgi:hypothetical protein